MPTFNEVILKVIEDRLRHLGWKCTGCPQTSVCEDQANGGEGRYCWFMIEAAILGNETWETDHDPEKLRRQE